ncbi:glycosyltransferase family 4 protein [Rhodonellum sp.]|uniref:glycosyltransferase family 4 protein n=1 Tax=Rhodonellum sp. TaxID=2231180 RepID=UPI00272138BB|nr:glycosyltransferase family 4 protein [Rhodonellum sp.]MDO9551439.1 glycosyltransferase family 4 protein [Rhodonellum sp.]
MKRIVFFHLLNNYTGSPMVLRNVIQVALSQKYKVDLYTSNSEGFLSGIPGITYHNNHYKRYNQKALTFFSFFASQIVLGFQLFMKYRKTDSLFYVNTILPFGGILMGRWMGKRVITHVHEFEISPKLLNRFLFGIVNRFSKETVVVSHFLTSNPNLKNKNVKVIYNSITEDFEGKAKAKHQKNKTFNVLMLASLRPYKGIFEFIELGNRLPQFTFTLVVSDSADDLKKFISEREIPKNVQIFPVQADVHPFYRNADLILNLAVKSQVVETFGLTILEGMYYGLPAIVPISGGITELVQEGFNGFHRDSTEIDEIVKTIETIATKPGYWNELHLNSLTMKEKFSRNKFETNILKLLTA